MNCDDAIEYLPWLLNGSLEDTERDEVQRHLETCERCRAALRDTREAWTVFSQHLPSEALVALAYGEVPEGIDPAVAERHLASCPECAVELELAHTSRLLENGEDGEDGKIVIFPGPRPKGATETGERRSWRAAALAASLAGLVAATGWLYEFQQVGTLSGELARKPAPVEAARPLPAPAPAPAGGGDAALKDQVAQLTREAAESQQKLAQAQGQLADLDRKATAILRPQVNSWVGQLGNDVVRGGGGEAQETAVPRDRFATPLLEADANGEQGPREVEILDAGGKKVWGTSGLRATADGAYSITFPPGFFPAPGRYRINLYASANGRRVPRESYKIRVE
jgi:anti-sigma factor RsiW